MTASGSVHIFVDNSNVIGGARRAAKTKEPSAHWAAVRVYYRNMFAKIEAGRAIATKVMAGSVPPGNDDLWDYARDHGYDVDLLNKVEKDNGNLGEQMVDELLHLKIANLLLDTEAPETLVLVTGDGRESEHGTSFPLQITRALKLGWNVEVWSWKDQLSHAFSNLPLVNGTMTIRTFDPDYFFLTFLKAGDYVDRATGAIVKIMDRPVERLLARTR